MSRNSASLIAVMLMTSSCATHQLIVPNPNPTDQTLVTVSSNAFGFGAVQRRNVATECATNLIDEVRVRQNLAQALATVLTLGLWMPAHIEYRCAKVPSTTGEIGAADSPGDSRG